MTHDNLDRDIEVIVHVVNVVLNFVGMNFELMVLNGVVKGLVVEVEVVFEKLPFVVFVVESVVVVCITFHKTVYNQLNHDANSFPMDYNLN